MNESVIWLIASAIIGFIIIAIYRKINLKKQIAIGIDINKPDQRKICEGAGIAMLIGIWITLIAYSFNKGFNAEITAWALLISIFSIIGFFDDTQHKFLKKAIGWKIRALPIAIASIAFAYFFSPNSIWIIPIALFIAGIASFQNTFAGLNGWQGGSGLIIAIATTIIILHFEFSITGFILIGSIIAFLFYNFFPARVFEGDSGTLLIGSGIAGMLVMTKKIELMALGLLFFLPHIIDFFALKMLTNPKDASQAKQRPYKLLSNQKLAIPDYAGGKQKLDFAKLIIKIIGPSKEWKIVIIIWLIVALNAIVWLKVFGIA